MTQITINQLFREPVRPHRRWIALVCGFGATRHRRLDLARAAAHSARRNAVRTFGGPPPHAEVIFVHADGRTGLLAETIR